MKCCCFYSSNSVNPDEMSHHVAFHQGLHFLPKFLYKQDYCLLSNIKGSDHAFKTWKMKISLGMTSLVSSIYMQK